MTDIQQRLGKLIEGPAERDAIHIAVVPMIAGIDLRTGEKVRLQYDSTEIALDGEYNDDAVGIVDPFLDDYLVRKGQRFWCYLFPGTVTGMRHHWEHPAFKYPKAIPNTDHEKWLRDFAERWNFDWDELIAAATSENESEQGNYATARGYDLHSAAELGDEHVLFWLHLEGFTGKVFSESHREKMGWSCTC